MLLRHKMCLSFVSSHKIEKYLESFTLSTICCLIAKPIDSMISFWIVELIIEQFLAEISGTYYLPPAYLIKYNIYELLNGLEQLYTTFVLGIYIIFH